jgi:hypothetical protein
VLLAVCISAFAFGGYLQRHLDEARPQQPEPLYGRVYPITPRARIVYVTRREKLLWDYELVYMIVFAVTGFSGAILNRRWKAFPDPREKY